MNDITQKTRTSIELEEGLCWRQAISKELGVVFAALLAGTLINSDQVTGKVIQSPPSQDFLVAVQPPLVAVNTNAQTQSAIASLADGNYQFCSQPDPHDWRDGVGVCFNFRKVARRVDGYYGYPHSDDFICVKGKVNGNLIKGEALAILWDDRQWTRIPESAFKWDLEGRLTLSQGSIIRTYNYEQGRIDLILFRSSVLNLGGFYQYDTLRMKPSSELCDWNSN